MQVRGRRDGVIVAWQKRGECGCAKDLKDVNIGMIARPVEDGGLLGGLGCVTRDAKQDHWII